MLVKSVSNPVCLRRRVDGIFQVATYKSLHILERPHNAYYSTCREKPNLRLSFHAARFESKRKACKEARIFVVGAVFERLQDIKI